MSRLRSAAQIAASRRNGARSRGPKSEAAKAASSQNAVKHGLFRRHLDGLAGDGEASNLMRELELGASSHFDVVDMETALTASRQLQEAMALAHALQERMAVAFAEQEPAAALADLLGQLARIARYQRRFRGQRDRALRGLGGSG